MTVTGSVFRQQYMPWIQMYLGAITELYFTLTAQGNHELPAWGIVKIQVIVS